MRKLDPVSPYPAIPFSAHLALTYSIEWVSQKDGRGDSWPECRWQLQIPRLHYLQEYNSQLDKSKSLSSSGTRNRVMTLEYPGNALQVTGTTEIEGDLNVGGTTLLNSTLSVSGNVGIGTTTPTVPLDISGNCIARTFNTTSDYRIKSNVQPIPDEYTIDNLRPVH